MHDSESPFGVEGPLIPLGVQKCSLKTVASAGFSPGPAEFDVECFHHVESESFLDLKYNGKKLNRLGVSGDRYGFGTSVRALHEKTVQAVKDLEGLNADLDMTAVLNFRLCYLSKDPVYGNGAQSVFYVSHDWRIPETISLNKKTEFEVWKNGKRLFGADLFFYQVEKLISQDAAPNRIGGLMIDRGRAFREDFGTEKPQDTESAPGP